MINDYPSFSPSVLCFSVFYVKSVHFWFLSLLIAPGKLITITFYKYKNHVIARIILCGRTFETVTTEKKKKFLVWKKFIIWK